MTHQPLVPALPQGRSLQYAKGTPYGVYLAGDHCGKDRGFT